jgi:argininosuccinate synthase
MKIVLAYSGGLDTSVIVKWLKETYDAEIVTFAADIGQEEELKGLRRRRRRPARRSTTRSTSSRNSPATSSTR